MLNNVINRLRNNHPNSTPTTVGVARNADWSSVGVVNELNATNHNGDVHGFVRNDNGDLINVGDREVVIPLRAINEDDSTVGGSSERLRNVIKTKTNIEPKQSHLDNQLLDRLSAEDTTFEKNRLEDVVGGGYVHATHLDNICLRAVYLHSRYNIPVPMKQVTSNDRLTWNTGRGFEKHVRKQLIKSFGENQIFGISSCRCENLKSTFPKTEKSIDCDTCKTDQYHKYHEHTFSLDEFGVVGNADFGYIIDNDKLILIEIKSIKKEEFEKLKKPQPPHKNQILRYYYYAKLLGFNVSSEVQVVYVSKGYIGKLGHGDVPYKSFTIDTKNEDFSKFDRELETGKLIKQMHNNESDLKVERNCNSCECATAKKCAVSGICFSLNHIIKT